MMPNRAVPLWFCGGEKGGVGKSACAHLLIDYLREHFNGHLLVVETDTVNPDVGRTFFDKEVADVEMCPLKIGTVNDWLRFMDLIQRAPSNAVLINGAAQLYSALEIGRQFIKSLGELNRHWITWWVIGPEIDSADILDRYRSMLGAGDPSRPQSHHLIVIENAGRSDERDFTSWRKTNVYKALRDEECPIVEVSHIATDVADEIRDRYWSIAEARAELRFAHRVELERWRNAAFASISQALGDG